MKTRDGWLFFQYTHFVYGIYSAKSRRRLVIREKKSSGILRNLTGRYPRNVHRHHTLKESLLGRRPDQCRLMQVV